MTEINKRIISLFVEKETLADVSDFVNYVFDTASKTNDPPFDPDSVVMPGSACCPQCGASEESLDDHTITLDETTPFIDEEADPDERYVCPICGVGYPTQTEARECCAGLECYVCLECGHVMTQEEYDELVEVDIGLVKQWVLVTPWLAKKLEDRGEIMIEGRNIWGRISSGSIAEEDVISDICKDIGILQGQSNDWSKMIPA